MREGMHCVTAIMLWFARCCRPYLSHDVLSAHMLQRSVCICHVECHVLLCRCETAEPDVYSLHMSLGMDMGLIIALDIASSMLLPVCIPDYCCLHWFQVIVG